MKQIIEKYRQSIIAYCLTHGKNKLCNYMLFQLLSKTEIKKLTTIISSLKEHREIKEKFYG